MKIILIEDDDIKRSHILELLAARYPEAEVVTAKSYNSGLEAVTMLNASIVLLDMTLTTFDVGSEEDGGSPRALAGMELMGQMDRHEVRTPVIVVTQYDVFQEGTGRSTLAELETRLYLAYPDLYRGAVYYNHASDAWKDSLAKLIEAGALR